MFETCCNFVSALSGEDMATLNIEDVDGKPARAERPSYLHHWSVQISAETNSGRWPDRWRRTLSPQKVQLVFLQFLPPDVDAEEKLLAACREDDIQVPFNAANMA